MPDEISFLPEEQRKKEDELLHPEAPKAPARESLHFSVPKPEADDVEVIEIDEGEVNQVLAKEPPLSRFMYKAGTFFQDLGHKLFAPNAPEPPPKLPPQFFTPPAEKSAPKPAAPSVAPTADMPVTAGAQRPKAKIMPDAHPGAGESHRVRLIKRIRKPLHVSFVSDEDLRLLRIDVPKRRFTFFATMILFAILLGGGWYLLNIQADAAHADLSKATAQFNQVGQQIKDQQVSWNAYQDLQPRLKALLTLLQNHVSPTKLFEEIEQHTLPTVSYDAFTLSSDGRVTLQVTTDSFQSAAEQIVAFQSSDFVTKVEASGYSVAYDPPDSVTPSAVKFQMTLTLADNAMRLATAH